MNKEINELRVYLKQGLKNYTDCILATSSDVAFLMRKEIADLDDDCFVILNLNSTGRVINFNICNVSMVENNINTILASSITSNTAAIITIAKSDNDRIKTIVNKMNNNYLIIGIKMYDHIFLGKDRYKSYNSENTIKFGDIDDPAMISYSNEKYSYDYNDKFKRIEHKSIGKIELKNDTYEEAIKTIANEMRYFDREHLCVISLDENKKPLNYSYVSVGDVSQSIGTPREALKTPIISSANSVIFLHNHPSGSNKPSHSDYMASAQLTAACNLLGITCEDHLIISNSEIISITENPMFDACLKPLNLPSASKQPVFKITKNVENNCSDLEEIVMKNLMQR